MIKVKALSLLGALFSLLLASNDALAAYAFVQAKTFSANSSSATTTGIVSFTSGVTAGNTLIVAVVFESATVVPVSTITDQSANVLSFTAATSVINGTANSMRVYYLVGVPAGITGLIVNTSTAGVISFDAAEYSGITGVLDGAAGGASTQTTAISFPPITNSNQPAIFYAVSFDDTTVGGPTAGSGFTSHGNGVRVLEPANSGNIRGIFQDKRLTTTGTQTAIMTSGGITGDLILMASFAIDEVGSVTPSGPSPTAFRIF